MPTIITYSIGTGRNYETLQLFKAFIATLDLIALNQAVIALVYENQHLNWGISNPLTSDSTHHITIQPAPGLGVNDLDSSGPCNYGTEGIELTSDWTINIPDGIHINGFRVNATISGFTLDSLSGGLTVERRGSARRCRILVNQALDFGNYGLISAMQDCLVLFNSPCGVANFTSFCALQRNTFVNLSVIKSGALLTFVNDTSSAVEDNIFINFGDIILAGPDGAYRADGYIHPGKDLILPPFIVGIKTTRNTFRTNYTDTPLNVANSVNALPAFTYAANLVVSTSDYRPNGAAIGSGSIAAISTNDLRGNNRGVLPDIGALQFTSAMALPTINIIPEACTGQSTVIGGTDTGEPTSGSVTMLASSANALSQGPISPTLDVGSFSAAFSSLMPGIYTPQVTLTNAGGSTVMVGPDVTIIEISGNPIAEQAPSSTGGPPSVTILTVRLTGRILNANGIWDFQNDHDATLLAYLDPLPSGTTIPITATPLGVPTPNIVKDFWGLKTVLSGNRYQLRLVATANGYVATDISSELTVGITSGTMALPDADMNPTLTFVSWSNRGPGVSNTATFAFIHGMPNTLMMMLNFMVTVTITNLIITTTSGSNASAAGMLTFDFTNPTDTGAYIAIVSNIGTYASTSALVTLNVISPSLTWIKFTNSIPNSGWATALYSFSDGLPDGVDVMIDGSTISPRYLIIDTTDTIAHEAAGTITFVYTNPNSGLHSFNVTTTGLFGVAAAPQPLVTADPSLTLVSWSSTMAGEMNTATFSFATGEPTGIIVHIQGNEIETSDFAAVTTSGSGALAVGTISFSFINPSRSDYRVVILSLGEFASDTVSTAVLSVIT